MADPDVVFVVYDTICPFCREIFDQDQIKDHIESKHLGFQNGKESFNCDKCEEEFKCESDLKIHENMKHSTSMQCNECLKCFTKLFNLRKHIRVKHQKLRYQCEFCEQSFTSNYYRLAHTKTRHQKIGPKCPTCEATFTSNQSMKNHIKVVHEKVKDLSCEHCQKQFSKMSNLKRHEVLHSKDHKIRKRI